MVGSSCRDCRSANLLAGTGLVASPIRMALERAQPAMLRRELLHQPALMAVARAIIFANLSGRARLQQSSFYNEECYIPANVDGLCCRTCKACEGLLGQCLWPLWCLCASSCQTGNKKAWKRLSLKAAENPAIPSAAKWKTCPGSRTRMPTCWRLQAW